MGNKNLTQEQGNTLKKLLILLLTLLLQQQMAKIRKNNIFKL